MRVVFHPEFPSDTRRFKAQYAAVSARLAGRFQTELDRAVEAIKTSPTGAGHFLNLGSSIVRLMRRRNLKSFPFFVLYSAAEDRLMFGAIIPSRSDPLTWLARFHPSDAID
jgi:hypothetical protein